VLEEARRGVGDRHLADQIVAYLGLASPVKSPTIGPPGQP
jgi:hypothetical protein